MAEQFGKEHSRRDFMKISSAVLGLTGVAGLAGCNGLVDSAGKRCSGYPVINDGDVVLFQGDSITDAGRSRERADQANDAAALGGGYVGLAAGQLLIDRAGSGLKIYNRGISGHKVFQLADRWQKDCLDLKPNLLSILIGVNDIWHMLDGKYDGTVEVYEKDYFALVERTRKALPGVKLVICEPFVLRCGAVNDKWFPLFDHYRAVARKVARSFDTIFVPFQAMFDEASKIAPPNHWAGDGVHPTAAGASLMAHNWLKAVQVQHKA
ncbi:MAG: SGNH/GDSL hydrolase family protein [Sedimentisphaerales bacterium]|nr:SGNH/GDSL hydrolase family protein [Sedimentisphaerales bacterium]